MPDTANIEAVRGFLEAIYSGDLDRAFERYAAPDFFWVVSTVDNDELRAAIPWAGRRLEGKGGRSTDFHAVLGIRELGVHPFELHGRR